MAYYKCTRCNTQFEFDSDREALFCPLCGSTARMTPAPRKTVSVSGNKNVSFVDGTYGYTIASATLPASWNYSAQIQNYAQSKAEPFLTFVQATRDGSTIFAKSGENFLDIRNSIIQDEVFREGQMDQYFSTPMMTMKSGADYVNSIAPSLLGNVSGLKVMDSTTLPSYYGQNSDVLKKKLTAESTELSKQFASSQVKYETIAAVTEFPLVQYTFTRNRKKGIMLLGADMGAYEFHLSVARQQTMNMMGLLSNLMGQSTAGMETGIYINWGSRNVFGLITDEEHFNDDVQAFINFVKTYRVDKDIENRKANGTAFTTKQTRNTTTVKNTQGVNRQQTTTNNNQSLNVTDILMSLLNINK